MSTIDRIREKLGTLPDESGQPLVKTTDYGLPNQDESPALEHAAFIPYQNPYSMNGRPNDPSQDPPMGVNRVFDQEPSARGAQHQYMPSKEAMGVPPHVSRWVDVPTTIGGIAGGTVIPANGVLLDKDCGHPIFGIQVDNYSSIWIYIEAAARYVPPKWVGMSFPVLSSSEKIRVLASAPPGYTQSTPTTGEAFCITATEERLGFSGGSKYVVSPSNASPVLAPASGTATQAATNIAAGIVPANTVFTGSVNIALSAAQSSGIAAVGTSKLVIAWVPGTSGTAAASIAEVDIQFGAGLVTSTQGISDAVTLSVSVPGLYAGTTAGTFTAAVVETGTITARLWSVSIVGVAQ